MDEDRPNVCGVCQEDFNPTARCPRIFSCLHTLCTECIEKLIKTKSKQCPFCRKNFSACEASEIRVNHTMLELMKVLSHQKSNIGKNRERQNFPEGEIFQHVKTETLHISSQLRFKCKEVQQEMEQVMRKCQELHIKIGQDNDQIENALLPIIHRLISDNTNMLEELDTTRKELLMELEKLKGKHAQLEEVEEKIEATSSFKEAGSIMDISEETSHSIREWIESSKAIIADAERKLEVSKQANRVTEEKITLMLKADKEDYGMTNYTRYGIWVLVLTVLLVAFPIFVSFYTPKENLYKSDDLPHEGLMTVEMDSSDRLLWMDSDDYAKNVVIEQDCSADSTVDLTLNTLHVDPTGLPVDVKIIVDQNEKEKCAEAGKCNPFIVGGGDYGNHIVSDEEGSANFANADLNRLLEYTLEPEVKENIIIDQEFREVEKSNPFIDIGNEHETSLFSVKESNAQFENADLDKLNDNSLEPSMDETIISNQVEPEEYTMLGSKVLISVIFVAVVVFLLVYWICCNRNIWQRGSRIDGPTSTNLFEREYYTRRRFETYELSSRGQIPYHNLYRGGARLNTRHMR